jgi:hypothetical protein
MRILSILIEASGDDDVDGCPGGTYQPDELDAPLGPHDGPLLSRRERLFDGTEDGPSEQVADHGHTAIAAKAIQAT